MKKIFIVFVIIVLGLTIRLININGMGRTWDETAQVIDGYHFVEFLRHSDFNNKYFYDHPFHPPVTKYIYGLTAHLDSQNTINPHPLFLKGEPKFNYDLTYSHIVSALLGTLSVIPIFLIGWQYFSPFVAITSSTVFVLLPFFVGLSQIASIESVLMFFFSWSIYAFVKFLEKQNTAWIFATGVLVGLAVVTKYSNILIYPLIMWIYLLWRRHSTAKKNDLSKEIKRIILIGIISLCVIFLVWPQPWFHLPYVLAENYKLRIADTGHSVPEIFFGRLMFVPKAYYWVMFLITTPFILLVFFFVGLISISGKSLIKKSRKRTVLELINHVLLFSDQMPFYTILKKNWWMLYVIVVWFTLPFIQSLYNFRQHGVRYIIEIYAPFSLIVAIGFDYLLKFFNISGLKKYIGLVALIGYMGMILWSISPYYLDYFNSVIGGNSYVYQKKLFQLGWWGEGIKEAALYVDNTAPHGSTVGLAVVPDVAPPLVNVKAFPYDSSKQYDYVIVNYFNVTREQFDDRYIQKNYYPIHYVEAGGAYLVTIYKKR